MLVLYAFDCFLAVGEIAGHCFPTGHDKRMASTPLSGSNIVKSQAVIVACSSVKRSRYGVLETRSAGAENASAVPFPVVDVLNGNVPMPVLSDLPIKIFEMSQSFSVPLLLLLPNSLHSESFAKAKTAHRDGNLLACKPLLRRAMMDRIGVSRSPL